MYIIKTYLAKIYSTNTYTKKKSIQNELCNKTNLRQQCISHKIRQNFIQQNVCNKHLYKKQLSNKNLVLTTKMLTKKVENGLQQIVSKNIYIYIKKLHTAKMYTT